MDEDTFAQRVIYAQVKKIKKYRKKELKQKLTKKKLPTESKKSKSFKSKTLKTSYENKEKIVMQKDTFFQTWQNVLLFEFHQD